MSSAFKYNFNVHGKTPFPMAMLSMEGCFPTTVVDGVNILDTLKPIETAPLLDATPPERGTTTINLTIITTDRYWQPKIEWWNKQGWTVGATRTELNERSY